MWNRTFQYFVIILLFTVLTNPQVFAQDRFTLIEGKLADYGKSFPGIDEKVKFSMNGASLQDFMKAVSSANNLNISVDESIDVKVSNSFNKISTSELIIFLCKKYNLDVTIYGSIISIVPYKTEPEKKESKPIEIKYNKETKLLSLDLKNDSLSKVVKEISLKTGYTILFAPELSNKIVTLYSQNIDVIKGLELLCIANNLVLNGNVESYFLITKRENEESANNLVSFSGKGKSKNTNKSTNFNQNIKISKKDSLVSIEANNVAVMAVINALADEFNFNYNLYSEPKENITINIKEAMLDDVFSMIFNGIDYTFKKVKNVYYFGTRNFEQLRSSKVIQLKFRSVNKIEEIIPAEQKKGLEIKVFKDLNSLVVSGSDPAIKELEKFIETIDKVVPVISIEILIVDVSNSKNVSTKLEAGLKSNNTKPTEGTIYPSIDMKYNANSINNLLSGITGIGTAVLGRVTPDFYFNLKLLEEQGNIKLRSTPMLATLNGNEAKLSIGRTEYYLEIANNVIGGVTSTITSQQMYRPVQADLTVTINPIVSGDNQITLDINVKQSSFTTRISPTAPPGTLTKDFQSLLRVKNEEMIILGGLEEDATNESSSGLPLLSRIPVLKWLFSNRTKSRSKSKLTIFIKPVVIYK